MSQINPNDYPTIISFYTKNWDYEKYVMELRDSCNTLGLYNLIKQRNTTNSYLGNTRIKPSFILEALTELKRPVLWIDGDGLLLNIPEFFNKLPVDFAAREMSPKRDRRWHVGTMYFNYNEKVLKMVKEWANLCDNNSAVTDEHALDILWKSGYFSSNDIICSNIPKEYFEILKKVYSSPPKNSIICHRISSDPDKMAMKKRVSNQIEKKRSNK